MELVNLLSPDGFWVVAKIFVLVGLAVYIGFAIVVVRQVRLMIDTVHLGLEGFLTLVSWVHLLVAVGLFLGALMFL